MADCAGLLNRCRALNPYREFESHPLRIKFKMRTVLTLFAFFFCLHIATRLVKNKCPTQVRDKALLMMPKISDFYPKNPHFLGQVLDTFSSLFNAENCLSFGILLSLSNALKLYSITLRVSFRILAIKSLPLIHSKKKSRLTFVLSGFLFV